MMKSKMVALGISAGALGIFMAGTVALGGAQAGSSAAAGTESGERTVEDGGTGPYKAVAVSNSSISTHTIYRPKDLSAFGDREKLPLLAWGNGGCANSNSGHQNYLSEIASHGYLIVAIGPMQAGGGRGGPGADERVRPAAGGAVAGGAAAGVGADGDVHERGRLQVAGGVHVVGGGGRAAQREAGEVARRPCRALSAVSNPSPFF